MTQETVVKLEITITDDGASHTTISCGKGRSFFEVLEGIRACETEIQKQIKDRTLCPFFPASDKA